MKLTRRQLLIAASALPLACKTSTGAVAVDPFAHLQFFVGIEARTMDAWLERLLPANVPPGTPGARDAGVLEYIDRTLMLPEFKAQARGVRRAAFVLLRAAKEQAHAQFSDLEAALQDDLIAQLQRGELNDKTNHARGFELVMTLALEGYLGNPAHGGNKGGVVWKSLGDSPACPAPRRQHHHE